MTKQILLVDDALLHRSLALALEQAGDCSRAASSAEKSRAGLREVDMRSRLPVIFLTDLYRPRRLIAPRGQGYKTATPGPREA
jgi:hypothetical protein